MTKELCARMSYEELTRAYNGYNALMLAYENTCGGIYAARQYKEYFAICDSRDNIRQEVLRRSDQARHGNGQ